MNHFTIGVKMYNILVYSLLIGSICWFGCLSRLSNTSKFCKKRSGSMKQRSRAGTRKGWKLWSGTYARWIFSFNMTKIGISDSRLIIFHYFKLLMTFSHFIFSFLVFFLCLSFLLLKSFWFMLYESLLASCKIVSL